MECLAPAKIWVYVVILERNKSAETTVGHEYRLLAAKRTSTLQKEAAEAMAAGYEFVGLTVADTAAGGDEVVCILRKQLR
jgi:hypothetical protein